MGRAFIYYWVPGDNDRSDHPNAFEVVHEGPGAKLKEIRASFPLPGEYHFRFKMKWESGAVWMDVTNEESMVPMFEDKVYAKVLRINWGASSRKTGDRPVSVPSASPDTSPQAASAGSEDLLFGDSSASGPPPSGAKGGPVKKQDDFDMLFG
mmetsp:Transcript_26619/g.49989  ORF Transcript_26619/g.49989 Transcript_26619/m.49989 type:complete len:152 (+) Transcript_26619:58-513(+)